MKDSLWPKKFTRHRDAQPVHNTRNQTASIPYRTHHDGNGNLMQICMESTRLEVGAYEPFLFLDYKLAVAQLLNDTWLTAIWKHISLCKGTITMTDPWLPVPQSEHDLALVSIAATSEFTDKQKKDINACRICIQVRSPSAIATFEGLNITQLAHDGKERMSHHRSDGQTNSIHPRYGGTHGKSSYFIIADGNRFFLQPHHHT
jgi:hypothetical protein